MDLLKILEKLHEEKPEVADMIVGLRKAILTCSSLDSKTINLVAIGIATAIRDQNALAGHIKLAKQSGASKDEVISAILVALPSAGVPATLAALPVAWENY